MIRTPQILQDISDRITRHRGRRRTEQEHPNWYLQFFIIEAALAEAKLCFAETPPAQYPGEDLYQALVELAARVAMSAELIAHPGQNSVFFADADADKMPDTEGADGEPQEWHEESMERPTIGMIAHDSPAYGQMIVFERALDLHVARSKKYYNMWQRYGWRGAMMQARSSIERAWNMTMPLAMSEAGVTANKQKVLDDLLDAINYCAFTYRNIADDNDGTWEW